MGSDRLARVAAVRTAMALTLAAGAVAPAAAAVEAAFQLGVDAPGVYRVTYESLAAAGPVGAGNEAVESRRLALSSGGEAVPIFLEDGGDGRFGPGDAFLFEGRQLGGEATYYAEYSRWNVYRLRFDGQGAERQATSPGAASASPVRWTEHREQQELRVRFAVAPGQPRPEVWYWAKLTAIDRDPFRTAVELPGLQAESAVELRVGLRGWSRAPGNEVDHRIEASWNGVKAGFVEWSEQDEAVLVATLPAASIKAKNELTLRVPRRTTADGKDPIIDVVLVDWIELEATGKRAAAAPRGAGWVKVDSPSSWKSAQHRADYLMIVHPSLAEAIEPLARFHRARGLGVEVVGIDDVYDEFAHGVENPAAIRDFVAWTRREWQAPAPRFVLLVGDASWDPFHASGDDSRYADWTYRTGEHEQFVKNASTPYAEDNLTGRNLVSTFSIDSYEGEAASDNYFVTVEGDDNLPDLAIGRFPVVSADEVAAIVAKTIRYATATESGDWQSRTLWITDQDAGFQALSDRLATRFEGEGLAARKIYPQKEEVDNVVRKAEILDAFGEGDLLVHFFGHGGRYIWRTGPPDLKKNHDLFTLADLDEIDSGAPLPVILSMTCYSAPFDHPTADSIGEKFLRLADRGAVAVIAASWRNSPTESWSQRLISELTRPGATIGEALQAAKRGVPARDFVETYNLLGDPALRLAVKPNRNVIRWQTASEVENFGYDVYRSESAEGPWARITADPVPGAGTTDEPQRYQFVDSAFDPTKRYYYFVESISLSGVREKFTPIAEVKPKIAAAPAATTGGAP